MYGIPSALPYRIHSNTWKQSKRCDLPESTCGCFPNSRDQRLPVVRLDHTAVDVERLCRQTVGSSGQGRPGAKSGDASPPNGFQS